MGAVRVCVCVLILNAVIKIGKTSLVDAVAVFIFLAVLCVSFFTPVSPVIFVIAAAVIGILVKNLGGAS